MIPSFLFAISKITIIPGNTIAEGFERTAKRIEKTTRLKYKVFFPVSPFTLR